MCNDVAIDSAFDRRDIENSASIVERGRAGTRGESCKSDDAGAIACGIWGNIYGSIVGNIASDRRDSTIDVHSIRVFVGQMVDRQANIGSATVDLGIL